MSCAGSPRVGFWETVPLPPGKRSRAIQSAANQDAAVLAIFRRNGGRPLSPSRVCEIGRRHGRFWLLTSVRRSITHLTGQKLLAKLSATREGPHGAPEHLWGLR